MKTNKIKISQIKINEENPRTITSNKFQKLVDSILVFPEMLELRPVVIDNNFTVLGGNMRVQAMKSIATMDIATITNRLQSSKSFNDKAADEQSKLIEGWREWLSEQTVIVVNASSLTESQKKEFIVKDNVSYGAWDYDGLANKFDNMKLQDWGMDVWSGSEHMFESFDVKQPTSVTDNNHQSDDEYEEKGGIGDGVIGQLPEELQGIDLTPAELPKIEGADETAMDRIIIVYPKEKASLLAGFLGLEKFDKVIYRLDEILPEE